MGAECKSLNLAMQTGRLYSAAEAFAYCERIARAHYENFPIGSLLVPKAKRKHVYSIYAFARTADDIADEGYEYGLNEESRLAALNDWESELEACYRSQACHPVFIALAETVKELRLPIELFRNLLSAFKQDVVKRRYANYFEVLDYCTRSANPIGRLVLLLFNYRDEHLHRLSDNICTGLQLTNFWQDVAVDIKKDRVYLPQEDMFHFGISEQDLREGKINDRFTAMLKHEVKRTRELFERGRPLPHLVKGRLSFELQLTWLGGMRILQRIEDQNYDTLTSRPTITTFDKMRLLLRCIVSVVRGQ